MRGFISMVLIIFSIILGFMFLESPGSSFEHLFKGTNTPITSNGQPTPNTSINGYCQAPQPAEAITFRAPRDEATKCPDGPGGSYKSGGDFTNNFQGGTTYKLVRKNVPLNKDFFTKPEDEHSIKAEDAGIDNPLDPTKFELWFPKISGEIALGTGSSPYSRTRDCGDRSYENQGLMYFIDYGLAFGLHLENGQPVEVSGYYIVDVFKDTGREQEIPPEAWALCSSDSSQVASAPTTSRRSSNGTRVMIPQQEESSTNAQLQLSYFLFSNSAPAGSAAPQAGAIAGWVDTCKPAVYLYPPQKQLVNVKVYPQGFLTYTDPIYDLKNGWTVEAHPNGMLYDSRFLIYDRPFTYLYYESKIRDEFIAKPDKGWVIQSSVFSPQSSDWFNPLEAKFNLLLPLLGLNTQQTADFIDYWKKALPYSPYYFIGVMDQGNIDQFEPLEITPKPDSINRVRIYFERLDEPKTVQAPILPDQPIHQLTNSLFHVTEWGGMVKNDPDHAFTCSQ